jgi:hypothetical protein
MHPPEGSSRISVTVASKLGIVLFRSIDEVVEWLLDRSFSRAKADVLRACLSAARRAVPRRVCTTQPGVSTPGTLRPRRRALKGSRDSGKVAVERLSLNFL